MNGPIAVVIERRQWKAAIPAPERLCRRFARAALAASGGDAAGEVRIALADDSAARELNRRFRGIDRATNVLAFPAHGEDTGRTTDPDGLGDILVAFETAAREAHDRRIALSDHLAHLVVHGVLHLTGFDHDRAGDAEAMETLEADILTRFGIADPYAGTMAEPER